ncbi:fumarylacetoacetate hydrolase family protein [Mycetocola sp.]|uniref:fumarylacetoacetate hydrolase family protein n=1 Tax=Mycetocola sp. TaxID=1871042 RepID=UPI0039899E53
MRLANLDGRAVIVTDDQRATDIAEASQGVFGPDLPSIYDSWDAFRRWAPSMPSSLGKEFAPEELDAVSPEPRQVFAVAMNYLAHAAEIGIPTPESPSVFTKFPSCLTGPYGEVPIPSDNCDFEVELVAVIGRTATDVDEANAWSYVAGLTIGQDISERFMQTAGPMPQFSLSKSFPRFGPVGPFVVTPDDFDDLCNIEVRCTLNGEIVQSATTGDLIFSIPNLISRLSRNVTLHPGDLIFTGTPAGVGVGRTPQKFLRDGDELVSTIRGIGEMRQRIVAG